MPTARLGLARLGLALQELDVLAVDLGFLSLRLAREGQGHGLLESPRPHPVGASDPELGV